MNNIKQALESAIKAMLSMEVTIAQNLGVSISDDEANAVLECKAALAELDECEPVAWYLKKEHTGKVFFHKDEVDWCIENEGYTIEQLLYDKPQPRDWVSLSEQQIREIKDTNPNNLVKSTEAKLKQLNTKG